MVTSLLPRRGFHPLPNLKNESNPFPLHQTLVFIALNQPIIQSELVAQRGTHSYGHIRNLVDKKIVDAIPEGRPRLLATTKLFADHFRLDSDRVKLKAQLKFKMKKILEDQCEVEETVRISPG